jgi:hypothetical protein
MEFPPHAVGFGIPGGKNDFWLQNTDGVKVPPIHLAFHGQSEEEVNGFHAAAL